MQVNIKNSELWILIFVSFMALAANLPDDMFGNMVDRNLLLVTLVATVVISLFRYLKLALFISVSVLSLGANLPEQLAAQLGLSQLAMIVASGVLVLVAFMYKLYYLKQPEVDSGYQFEEEVVSHTQDTIESRMAIIAAIIDGDFAGLHQLLISDVEVNFSQNGNIPLFLAIEKGNPDIVLLLLTHGAQLRVKNKEGKTPIEYALLREDMRISKIIHYAAKQNLAIQNRAVYSAQQKKKVVVMFGDVCGSTALYDQLGNETALNVITRTLNILIQEVATHKGTLIKTIGDEIMCTFPNVAVASQAARAMQFAVNTRCPGGKQPIHVRIGFHYGEVIYKANDVFGDTVNVAARVTAITRARQILTTQAVADALPSELADKVRPVIRAALRGKQDSLAVFQILWEPENSLLGRIGEAIFRKRIENGGKLFGDDRVTQHQPKQIELREVETTLG